MHDHLAQIQELQQRWAAAHAELEQQGMRRYNCQQCGGGFYGASDGLCQLCRLEALSPEAGPRYAA